MGTEERQVIKAEKATGSIYWGLTTVCQPELLPWPGPGVPYKLRCVKWQMIISQLPKLCVKISILMHRRMWVRSFSTRLTSVTFAEDKVLIFLILRKNAKIVQADWSDKLEWYIIERYIVF